MNIDSDRPQLKKAIGGVGFFSLAFGSMIGVGWITALSDWFVPAGPLGAILAFVAGGGLMMLIGLCYAELTPMLPVTGGEVAYAYKSFGTGKAFVVGWFLVFGYISVAAFEAVSIGMVLAFLFPQLDCWPLYAIHGSTVYLPHLLLAFFFTGLVTVVNYFGVGVAMRFQVLLTAVLLLCTMMFVVVGISQGSLENLQPGFGEAPTGSVWAGMLTVFIMVPFWFVGFDTIPQAAEEGAPGQSVKRLGLYILLAIVGSTIFYVLVMLAAGMAAPWRETVEQPLPTAAAFESAFESTPLVKLVLVAGVIGLLTSWNGFFIAGTRVLFSLGRGRIIDARFGQAHPRYGTPAMAIVFSGLITAVASCLGRGALIAFVNVGSFCIAIAFLGVALSFLKLRKTHPDAVRPFRLPYGRLVAGLAAFGSAFILSAMILPWSPVALAWPLEWAILAVLCLCGVAFWITGTKQRKQTDEQERSRLILEDQ